jgi:hypothetical protein
MAAGAPGEAAGVGPGPLARDLRYPMRVFTRNRRPASPGQVQEGGPHPPEHGMTHARRDFLRSLAVGSAAAVGGLVLARLGNAPPPWPR